jgi:hypothetical protein
MELKIRFLVNLPTFFIDKFLLAKNYQSVVLWTRAAKGGDGVTKASFCQKKKEESMSSVSFR